MNVIDENGNHVRILLSAEAGITNPFTISFRECDNTLVNGGFADLLVFKLG